MADIAAAMVGIITFAVQTTKVLYEVGSTVAGAKQEVDLIARHVTLYVNVLDVLVDRLEIENAIHSEKALVLIQQLRDQSFDLFKTIRDALPVSNGLKISWRQRFVWILRKTKVDFFVRELESLKSTVQLLAAVLFAGHKLDKQMKIQESPSTTADAVSLRITSAQNALIEYIDEAHNLDSFMNKQPMASDASVPATVRDVSSASDQDYYPDSPSISLTSASDVPETILASIAIHINQFTDPLEKRKTLLRHMNMWTYRLLEEWTTVDLSWNAKGTQLLLPATGPSSAGSDTSAQAQLDTRQKLVYVTPDGWNFRLVDVIGVRTIDDLLEIVTGELGEQVEIANLCPFVPENDSRHGEPFRRAELEDYLREDDTTSRPQWYLSTAMTEDPPASD